MGRRKKGEYFMKNITYYLPLIGPKKVTVVLLIQHSVVVSRGIAFCSSKDQFNRRLGREIAYGRAYKAYYNRQTCKNNWINRPILRRKYRFENKCDFMPVLTNIELKLLEKIKGRI